MHRDSGLDDLIEILERYRAETPFATVTIQIRDHAYVHVKKTVTESTPIRKAQNASFFKTAKNATPLKRTDDETHALGYRKACGRHETRGDD